MTKKALAIAFTMLAIGGFADKALAQGEIAPGVSNYFFANFENVFRPDANGDYQFVDVTTTPIGTITVGWAFAGIANFQNIDNLSSGVTTFAQDPSLPSIHQLSGIFASRVEAIHLAPVDPFDAGQTLLDHIALGPVGGATFYRDVDGDGVLSAGDDSFSTAGHLSGDEQFAFYRDVGLGTPFASAGVGSTMASTVASATDGTLFMTLGYSDVGGDGFGTSPATAANDNGYIYSHTDLGQTLGNFAGEAFLGMNVIQNGTGVAFVRDRNDINESEIGGVHLPPTPPFKLNDFIGTSELEANQNAVAFGGTSPWQFASNDPIQANAIAAVPEPSSLVLCCVGLASVGLARLRKARRTSRA
jgi:hypothetical protein